MICLDCRTSPTGICAIHAQTSNHDTEQDMEIDRLRAENAQLRGKAKRPGTEYAFTVPGKPMPWQRTLHGSGFRRGGRPSFFTAPETRAYQEKVRICALAAGVRPLAGQVEMEIRIVFPDNRVRDDDNVEKSIRDALQAAPRKGLPAVAFANDHQVKHVDRWVLPAEKNNPRVEVVIRALEEHR